MPAALRDRTIIFSSYFYQKLRQTDASSRESCISNYLAVSRWTKDVDIFAKDFLLIPICENSHWKLVVVCYPRAIFDAAIDFYRTRESRSGQPRTCMLFFCSLEAEVKVTAQVIRSYIETEYFVKKVTAKDREVFKQYDGYHKLFTTWRPSVPQQQNSYDCGIFVMEYAERFLRSPDVLARQISVCSVGCGTFVGRIHRHVRLVRDADHFCQAETHPVALHAIHAQESRGEHIAPGNGRGHLDSWRRKLLEYTTTRHLRKRVTRLSCGHNVCVC